MILGRLRAALLAIFAIVLSTGAQAEPWYRAESHHFVIYGKGSQKSLEDLAHKVEQFDALLRLVFRREPEQQPNRLTIYLLGDAKAVDDLIGPGRDYTAGFYRPSASGSFAVANRERGYSESDLDGQTVLFHEYAHHFMYRNFPVPAPAWFSEGFAEYASTAEFARDGSFEFGNLPLHRGHSLLSGPKVPIRKLLTDQPSGSIDEVSAFYGWSWALTHLFYRSNDRGTQITRYLAALANGAEPLAAAETEFGNLDTLDKQLQKYVRGGMTYSSSDKPLAYLSDIKTSRLSDSDSELVELTLQQRTGYKRERTRQKLRELTARSDATAEAWYQLAEVEHALSHAENAPPRYDFKAAEAAVDRALALDPRHVLANVLKGDIILEPFDHGNNPDPGLWSKARVYFAAGNRADPLHPLPLYKFANTFLREGKPNAQMGEALAEAFLGAPEAYELRFALANHYANEHDYDRAIALLKVIAGNPHTGSDARKLIAELEKARNGKEDIAPASTEEPEEGVSDDADQ